MKQCEIWYANLNPSKGSKQQGFQPVVIISGNVVNQYLNTVIACPLTTKIKNYKGNVILEPTSENGLSAQSEILTFHIHSISKKRLIKKIGKISVEQLALLKQCLTDILKY